MKDNTKKINAFITLGIVAIGAIMAVKEPKVHRYIDNKLYQYKKNTFFQPIEDYRFNILIDYVSKHSSLNDVVSFENIAEYKESLKDIDVFEGELAAMQAYVKDNQKNYESNNLTVDEFTSKKESKLYNNDSSESLELHEFNNNPIIGNIYKIRNNSDQPKAPISSKSKFI
jgi:hypothetical protein